jgi:phage terminase large subunit-like protein
MKMRENVIFAKSINTGWAEWSVDHQSPVDDIDLWYETNPSLGYPHGLTERKIKDEITNDDLDFNIQRLGYWVQYNQKSVITENEWAELKEAPTPRGKLHIGIKYGHNGKNVAMALAVHSGDKIFVEALDCQSIRNGNQWIVDFLLRQQANIAQVVVDGANGQEALKSLMKDFRLKEPRLPTVKEVTMANSMFEQAIFQKTISHNARPSLVQVATNCEKRAIGSNGGFGYRSQIETADIALLDSVILAHWSCANYKERKKQSIQY